LIYTKPMEDAVPLTKYDMEKLKSEVFWDYQITKENLIKMARSDDLRERKHLFEKILFYSTELIMKLPGIFFLMKKKPAVQLCYRIESFPTSWLDRIKIITPLYISQADRDTLVRDLREGKDNSPGYFLNDLSPAEIPGRDLHMLFKYTTEVEGVSVTAAQGYGGNGL
jgi:hypothetical protein